MIVKKKMLFILSCLMIFLSNYNLDIDEITFKQKINNFILNNRITDFELNYILLHIRKSNKKIKKLNLQLKNKKNKKNSIISLFDLKNKENNHYNIFLQIYKKIELHILYGINNIISKINNKLLIEIIQIRYTKVKMIE